MAFNDSTGPARLEVVVMDASEVPANGVQVCAFLNLAAQQLGVEHMLTHEFCELCKVQEPDLVTQLRVKREKERLSAAKRLQKASATSSSSSDKPTEGDDGKTAGDTLASSFKEFLDSKSTSQTAASYAPAPRRQFGNSLASGSMVSGVPIFLDPLKDRPESADMRTRRGAMYAVLMKVAANHIHILESIVPGNVAAAVDAIKEVCLGSEDIQVCDAVTQMVLQSLKPVRPWPKLAKKLNNLAFILSQVTDPEIAIGSRVLPRFALRALSHYDEYKFEVSLLHKLRGVPLTVQYIIQQINKLHGESMQSGGVLSAHMASLGLDGGGGGSNGTLTGFVAEPNSPVCRNFGRTGSCSYGDRCKFQHIEGTGAGGGGARSSSTSSDFACYECGAKDHGIKECPKYKARIDQKKNLEAKQAELRKEMSAMRAQLEEAKRAPPLPTTTPPSASATAITGHLSATYDPYAVYGPDAELSTVFSTAPGLRASGLSE